MAARKGGGPSEGSGKQYLLRQKQWLFWQPAKAVPVGPTPAKGQLCLEVRKQDFYHHPVSTLGCNLRLSYHWTPFVPSDIGGDWNRSFPRFPSSFKFIKYTVTRWPHCPWSSDFPGKDFLGRTCSKSPAPNFTGNVWVPRRDRVLIWPKSWMKILLDGKSLGSGLYSSFKMQF